ncbi:hypothetical protein J2T13_004324 [Paenibacillus sp. DS2015]
MSKLEHGGKGCLGVQSHEAGINRFDFFRHLVNDFLTVGAGIFRGQN